MGVKSSEITWVIQKCKFGARPCSIFLEIVKNVRFLTIFHHFWHFFPIFCHMSKIWVHGWAPNLYFRITHVISELLTPMGTLGALEQFLQYAWDESNSNLTVCARPRMTQDLDRKAFQIFLKSETTQCTEIAKHAFIGKVADFYFWYFKVHF